MSNSLIFLLPVPVAETLHFNSVMTVMRRERALPPSPPSPRQGGKRHMEFFVEATDSLAAQADGWQVCHWLNVLFSFSLWGVKQSVEWSIARLTNPQFAFFHPSRNISFCLSSFYLFFLSNKAEQHKVGAMVQLSLSLFVLRLLMQRQSIGKSNILNNKMYFLVEIEIIKAVSNLSHRTISNVRMRGLQRKCERNTASLFMFFFKKK